MNVSDALVLALELADELEERGLREVCRSAVDAVVEATR